MNSRFDKYLKVLQGGNEEAKEFTLAELHRSFSSLSQEEQKIAEIFLHDIQRGDVQIDASRTFRDYLADYQAKAKNSEIDTLVALMNTHVTHANINEFGRFDNQKPPEGGFYEAMRRLFGRHVRDVRSHHRPLAVLDLRQA